MKRRSPPVADSRRLYKVFVSSTFLDNQERRKLVQDAITMAGMVWHGMEIFTASTRPTVDECLRYAREADLLVGIIARRYGWEPDGNQSITEMEYDAAKERLMFLIDPNLPVNEEKDYDPGEERWDKQKKLAAFKKRIAGDQMPALFIETMLAAKVFKALDDWRNKFEPRPKQEDEVKHLVQWTGVPYPGLPAFKPEQAPIFFGRGPEIDQFLELLLDPAIRFLAVAGASGSGKSSLVAAGLIPRLRAGALPGSDQWVDITFRPTERGDNPFLALAYALKTSLDSDGQREDDLAEDLRATPARLATCAGELLAGRTQGAELLLVVDQFEEIFTRVNADLQRSFIELIETASRTARVRLIATIRSDFTANIADSHALAQLFRGRGYFLLSAPGPLALADMIRRPAQLAGLELKDDLCERILKDTGTGSGALALMAFALHEVYQRGKDSGRLTLQDYEALGGVSGAIKAQAERALERAGQTDERALHGLFSGLVEVNDQGVATRRRADLGEIRKNSSAARVADVLVDARILNAGSEPSHTPTIEVAHEAVFSAWPRLSTWIDSHAGELRTCRRLIHAAQEWKEAGAPRFRHLPDRATMKQYRKVRPVCPLGDDAEIVRCFMGAARKRQRAFTCLLVLVVFLFSILGTETWLRNREMNWNVLYIWTLSQFSLYYGPPMVVIPAGSFEIGPSDCRADDKRKECPQHTVMIQAFEMGKYEVTFDEYSVFLLDTDYSKLPPHDDRWGRGSRPIIRVNWEDAQAYIKWLNDKVRHNNLFRLPTEAEWEYACRANTETAYYSGNMRAELKQAGWYDENSDKQTHPVGEKKSNDFGLYDMHGNVWEWCEDYYKISPEENHQGLRKGSSRVMRGGSWGHNYWECRSISRYETWPDARLNILGFRLSRSVALGP